MQTHVLSKKAAVNVFVLDLGFRVNFNTFFVCTRARTGHSSSGTRKQRDCMSSLWDTEGGIVAVPPSVGKLDPRAGIKSRLGMSIPSGTHESLLPYCSGRCMWKEACRACS